MTLFQKALKTNLHSRFIARAEDLGRNLTDEETVEEAKYLIETIPYGGIFEGEELRTALRQLKRIAK